MVTFQNSDDEKLILPGLNSLIDKPPLLFPVKGGRRYYCRKAITITKNIKPN